MQDARQAISRGLQLLIIAGSLILPINSNPFVRAASADESPYTWKNGAGQTKTQADLEEILRRHHVWLGYGNCIAGSDGHVDLERQAYVQPAEEGRQAHFQKADLRGADLSGKDLRCVSFVGADLSKASLSSADLRGVLFTRATLSGASFIYSDLRGAIFNWADMSAVIYEPRHEPSINRLAYAHNLARLTTTDTPSTLVSLKKKFGEFGFFDAQTKVIAAINRWQAPTDLRMNFVDSTILNGKQFLRYVLFDLTCEYGSNPVRPLEIMAISWIIFALIYWAALQTKHNPPIVIVLRRAGTTKTRAFSVPQSSGLKAFMLAAIFSARNVVRLGFGQFDFGKWIAMLQKHDYELVAKGWMRTTSATQALLSLYLIALMILSTFGKPFDT